MKLRSMGIQVDCIARYGINTIHSTPTFFTRIIALKIKLSNLEDVHSTIWKEVLEIDSVGVHDGFFELWGDSILASQAIALMRKEFQKGLTNKSIFIQPKIEGLARDIGSHQSTGEPVNIEKTPDDVLIPLSFLQEQLWLLANLCRDNVFYKECQTRPVGWHSE